MPSAETHRADTHAVHCNACSCMGILAVLLQSAIVEAGLQMEAPPAPPDPSQPESSAAGAARHAAEV